LGLAGGAYSVSGGTLTLSIETIEIDEPVFLGSGVSNIRFEVLNPDNLRYVGDAYGLTLRGNVFTREGAAYSEEPTQASVSSGQPVSSAASREEAASRGEPEEPVSLPASAYTSAALAQTASSFVVSDAGQGFPWWILIFAAGALGVGGAVIFWRVSVLRKGKNGAGLSADLSQGGDGDGRDVRALIVQKLAGATKEERAAVKEAIKTKKEAVMKEKKAEKAARVAAKAKVKAERAAREAEKAGEKAAVALAAAAEACKLANAAAAAKAAAEATIQAAARAAAEAAEQAVLNGEEPPLIESDEAGAQAADGPKFEQASHPQEEPPPIETDEADIVLLSEAAMPMENPSHADAAAPDSASPPESSPASSTQNAGVLPGVPDDSNGENLGAEDAEAGKLSQDENSPPPVVLSGDNDPNPAK
jgi:hypothetical protein